MNTGSIDSYLEDGCGRCDKYQTPDCKVHQWHDILVELRAMLDDSVLEGQLKWGSPCYSLGGKNVVMLAAFKDYCSINFLKGAGLDDPHGILEKQGPNTRFARLVRFRSAEDLAERREATLDFIRQAIELERSGVEIEPEGSPEPMPEELEDRLAVDPDLQTAFDELTPGRQRSHILYVGGAKQSSTRVDRAERCVPKILAGKGYNER